MKNILSDQNIAHAELSFDNTKNVANLRKGLAIAVRSTNGGSLNAIITKVTPERIYARILLNHKKN